MSVKDLQTSDLCRRLADGWTAEHPGAPRELLSRLCARWQANLEQEWSSRYAYRAALELNQVRLQGASKLGCLILGNGADSVAEMADFWEKLGGTGRLGLVLGATLPVIEGARDTPQSRRCVFLADGEIEDLLDDPSSLEILKQHFRTQITTRSLLPYDITHPVASNMFFGRRELLDRLHNEESTSFAIAGPGRIGKSSLIKQYAYELRKNRNQRFQRLKIIDCYAYAHLDPDALARRIALDLAADAEAHRVNQETLLRFLHRHSNNGRQPFELLFDEVDSVCPNPVFRGLGEAVKEGYCRLILCGKGILHQMMRTKETLLANRLELIRPEPLDSDSAERLLFEPLTDLGFKVHEPTILRDQVFGLTRRLPQLIQDCAKRMLEFALAERTDTITTRHFQRVRDDFASLCFGMLPLDDLQDDLTRLVALLMLRTGMQKVTVGLLQELADAEGLALTAAKALDICCDLWICNFLTWEGGMFALVNPMLVNFAQGQEFLSREIDRLRSCSLHSHLSKSDLL